MTDETKDKLLQHEVVENGPEMIRHSWGLGSFLYVSLRWGGRRECATWLSSFPHTSGLGRESTPMKPHDMDFSTREGRAETRTVLGRL